MRDKLPWMIVAALCGALAAGALAVAEVPPRGATGCAQWETSVWQEDVAVLHAKAPELGKPVVNKGPGGGWEPFAVAPNGQLLYRRCAR